MKIIKSAPPEADHLPWSEKFRPNKLDEVQGNDHVVDAFARFIEQGTFPHLLFAGPPGTGKTTCAHILARQITGEEPYELNASDERGIDIVRDVIKEYASTVALSGSFKVIILDESDNMTRDAQQALRRTMEKYSGNCKFILIANDADGLIEPIRDRCMKFFFDPIPDDTIFHVLDSIAQQEGVDVSEDDANAIIDRSHGSLRSAITFLQVVASGSSLPPMPEKGASDILRLAMDGDFRGAASLYLQWFKGGPAGAQDFVDLMGNDILHGSDPQGRIALSLSQVQLGRGKQDYIQVLGFLARLAS